jgi:hypothetical protein
MKKLKGKANSILQDLYERIVVNWESTVAAILVIIGMVEWKRGEITTEDFITYVGVIGTIISLLVKNKGNNNQAASA